MCQSFPLEIFTSKHTCQRVQISSVIFVKWLQSLSNETTDDIQQKGQENESKMDTDCIAKNNLWADHSDILKS